MKLHYLQQESALRSLLWIVNRLMVASSSYFQPFKEILSENKINKQKKQSWVIEQHHLEPTLLLPFTVTWTSILLFCLSKKSFWSEFQWQAKNLKDKIVYTMEFLNFLLTILGLKDDNHQLYKNHISFLFVFKAYQVLSIGSKWEMCELNTLCLYAMTNVVTNSWENNYGKNLSNNTSVSCGLKFYQRFISL